ncbi:hypothetical protein LEP1GSC188_3387 [Leptospira weilii serovar Topaz str. LT2116]|uniref:PF13262 family protein n=1 Tax=Leptospira weilii serovar Topaz str. LT2116 TaxID=1088540 RepID=M3G828_9LEPT|nr:hypothetical protein LEP1GSC188_3387 [Leptospira weilii serovar Topaz str. LT2116]
MELTLSNFKEELPANHGFSDPYLNRKLSDANREVSELDKIPTSHPLFDFLQRLKALALIQSDSSVRRGIISVENTPPDSPTSFSLSGAFSVGFGGPKSESERIFGSGGENAMTEANSFEIQYKKALSKIRGVGGRVVS